MASRTLLAIGLSGFTALYSSPVLRAWYFIALCSLFAFAGLFATFDLALWGQSPFRRSLMNLRSILVQLSTTTETQRTELEGSSAAIQTNEDD